PANPFTPPRVALRVPPRPLLCALLRALRPAQAARIAPAHGPLDLAREVIACLARDVIADLAAEIPPLRAIGARAMRTTTKLREERRDARRPRVRVRLEHPRERIAQRSVCPRTGAQRALHVDRQAAVRQLLRLLAREERERRRADGVHV